MGQQNGHWLNEPDIGSGEKSPAQKDLEREQQALGQERAHEQRRADQTDKTDETHGMGETSEIRVLQQGDHLARVTTRALEDGTHEAQVYVRLTREPEVAETYIPAGIYPTRKEADAAALERAERALRDHEF